TMESLLSVAEEHLEVAKKNLVVAEAILTSLTPGEEKCLRLLRVSDYKFYKDRIKERVQGTCSWCLDHKKYQNGLASASGILLVSANPGCGKSVLARYLVEEGLPESATICYFFFWEAGQNTLKQALCALLHQLFQKKPHLIKHAMDAFKSDGDKLAETTSALWDILITSSSDPQAGPIIFVLDALDECREQEMRHLADMLETWFRRSNQSGSAQPNLKFLLTARPYERVVGAIQRLEHCFPTVRIKGEDEWKCLGDEISVVITYRIGELFRHRTGLSTSIPDRLKERMLAIPHRTYLWMHLVFDFLESNLFKATPEGVDEIIDILPGDAESTYAAILDKCPLRMRSRVRRTLLSIVGAYRVLTIRELQIIFELDSHAEELRVPDLESDEDFKNRIRNFCGLFISIHDNKVFLIHQTAKEFLLKSSAVPWLLPFDTVQADISMAETCMTFLSISDLYEDLEDFEPIFGHFKALKWEHFHGSGLEKGSSNPSSVEILGDGYWNRLEGLSPALASGNSIISALLVNDEEIVSVFLGHGLDINTKNADGNTLLHYWVRKSAFQRSVKFLLRHGADPNAVNVNGCTPLHAKMYKEICALLLDAGCQINRRDYLGQSPLFYHDSAGVGYLLSRGADPNITHNSGQTVLHFASTDSQVRVLVDAGVKVDARDDSGSTPLHTCL
ncbi:hypothetical protein B0T22DRAFT_378434, partial [Podospora appendiculata]